MCWTKWNRWPEFKFLTKLFSLCASALGRGTESSVLSRAIYGQILTLKEFFSLGMATDLGKWRHLTFCYILSVTEGLSICISSREISIENTGILSEFESWNTRQKKLATVVEGDQKAPFSIATTSRCRGGRYSFPRIAPLYPWYVPYIAEC